MVNGGQLERLDVGNPSRVPLAAQHGCSVTMKVSSVSIAQRRSDNNPNPDALPI